MAKDINSLYRLEKRDPASILAWLKAQGYAEEPIRIAMAEHAQMIADGKRFGYVNGISVLSNSIRARVAELTKQKKDDLIDSFGVFKPTERLHKRIWNKLKGKNGS